MRALAIKASRRSRRQETDRRNHDKPSPIVEDTHSKLEAMGKKNKVNAFRHGPSASQLQVTSSGMTRKNVSVSENETSPNKPQTRLTKKATPEASLRGWSGRSIDNYNSELPDPMLRRQRKFSTNSDFFSWKSFRDLGYSDYMIECLKKQLFHRPSHIQVGASTSFRMCMCPNGLLFY